MLWIISNWFSIRRFTDGEKTHFLRPAKKFSILVRGWKFAHSVLVNLYDLNPHIDYRKMPPATLARIDIERNFDRKYSSALWSLLRSDKFRSRLSGRLLIKLNLSAICYSSVEIKFCVFPQLSLRLPFEPSINNRHSCDRHILPSIFPQIRFPIHLFSFNSPFDCVYTFDRRSIYCIPRNGIRNEQLFI